jgi:hypothetical protein
VEYRGRPARRSARRQALHQHAPTLADHFLAGELRALRRLQRETGPSTHLFMSGRKAPISADGFQKMIERVSARAKLGFQIHAHMLRHACGFKMANDGVDTRTIQAYLGHKDIRHTVGTPSCRRCGSRGCGRIEARTNHWTPVRYTTMEASLRLGSAARSALRSRPSSVPS